MMLFKREGWPEEGELVICTVTKVLPSSVFANLDEYNKSGMIHISEIAPGRIRNIRDYVSEGRVVVCKILQINKEKGHIDLSLRRVSEIAKRKKLEEVKQEQKAEHIVENVAKEMKVDIRKLYDEITKKLFEKYSSLYEAFEDVVLSKKSLSDFGIEKKYADAIDEVIRQKIKPPEIIIGGTLSLSTYAADGVEVVKEALKEAEENKDVSVKYLGKGQYLLKVTSKDYKTAEKILKQVVDSAVEYVKKHEGEGSLERKEE
ncbi:translation initiation factor IF-2 subunit alpha [Candidatus Woesearchaeota archaeon]|nr:translation initiation factor IF-2 subunit alpha [Candidatus Woesearchaeota archaeon]